ncbi:CID domain-containing protein [Artemisia annua]|uniref:CID domain-containing protein n=1 Tax=Artemisia annua TaxID=35608 RepID=A0A2U1LB91_ARTAN|nr:CID domain-containing protein [Artemisia annua]
MVDLSLWDGEFFAEQEWRHYLKQRDRPYVPYDFEAGGENFGANGKIYEYTPLGDHECQPSGTSSSPSQKAVEIAYSKDSVMLHSFNGTAETVSVLEIPKPSSDAIENKESPSECNDTSVVSLAHSINEYEFETTELKEGSKKDPLEDVSEMHSDHISSNRENGAVLHDVNLLQSSPRKSCNDNAMIISASFESVCICSLR